MKIRISDLIKGGILLLPILLLTGAIIQHLIFQANPAIMGVTGFMSFIPCGILVTTIEMVNYNKPGRSVLSTAFIIIGVVEAFVSLAFIGLLYVVTAPA